MGSDGDGSEKGFVAKMIAVLRGQALGLGQAALLAYLLIDIAVYAVLGLVVRSAFRRVQGQEPWQDPKAFVVAVAATWAGNNATRPFRLAGAAALSPALEWTMGRLREKWGIGRFWAAIAILAVWGAFAVAVVIAVVLVTL